MTITHEEPRNVAFVERKMRSWGLSQSIADHQSSILSTKSLKKVGPFLTISREAGAGGSEIARLLGERLHWDVLDKNLVDHIAAHCHKPKERVALLDETSSSWAFDVLGAWLDSSLVPHELYVSEVTRIVTAAARHGKVIIVGRGAGFFLPRLAGLFVRIIAPLEYRVHRIMETEHLDATAARAYVDRTDQGRNAFAQRHFRRDLNNIHLYDLVVNVEHLGIPRAADLIYDALGPMRDA